MGTPDNKLSDLLDVVRSWIPRRSEPANVSRDFWMPDQSCRVCYECDSQFTVFNRRHHCRLCGLVFCAKCTTNSVPASFDESRTGREDSERIRVCNYCFRQWEQGIGALDNGTTQAPSPGLSPSASATSLASTKSSCTCYSSSGTVSSTPYSTGPYQHVPYTSCVSPRQSEQMDPLIVEQENVKSESSTNSSAAIVVNSSSNQSGFSMNRSDDEDDDYRIYTSDLDTRQYSLPNDYYGDVNIDNIDHTYGAQEVDHVRENINRRSLSCKLSENFDTQGLKKIKEHGDKIHEQYDVDECEAPLYDEEATEYEPVDFEKEGLLWIPPEPADEEDEREAILFDDDDDEGGTGEWGYLRSSNSFGSGEYRNRDKSGEEHRKALKNVVEGHFRALVAQLLQVENLPVGDENDRESWLEIITSLSWEAATLLKPDMSKCGGMDPGEYVKVKCLACGRRSESMVVKGVVCKKNVAHRRMTSKIDKPRFLILGGALEYQRVANHLSSVDTLLQQEMDHLKMAVTKIDAHHPNVLLVEKSVSRYAQEYLLAKDISLVLNIKRPLLERIARCTGAQIVPSIDHLTSQKLGYCDTFHVEKFLEEHGSAGQGGKKLSKTLMFVEGCPKPLGCTILLKGANGDNLKKAKHVVQYGVFAAYHLALETSFLADEGASLPQLPLKSPITVALPVKPSNIDRSISTIPGFMTPATGKPLSPKLNNELQKSNKGLISNSLSTTNVKSLSSFEGDNSTSHLEGPHSQNMDMQPSLSSTEATASSISLYPTKQDISNFYQKDSSPKHASKEEIKVGPKESLKFLMDDNAVSNCFGTAEPSRRVAGWSLVDGNAFASNHQATPELVSSKQDSNNNNEERGSSKEEFPPSPSDHRSILVSLSTRCVWKGSVCERPHLFRIKYYGSTDNPLGRFLRDNLFDQSYRCRSCDMPSEAHVHCYTHRQGSLTISVKKLSEILLPGEREGKIWMWHRCLRCPRTNGFPPATRRVVMSDAAWGLSFGKFLELSFSNHAAASRVANCGHSLHRDCLRFYGFGQMVACFRYASIDVNSVYLPPPKIEFNYDTQGWIKEEANEVRRRAELLFKDVRHTLQDLSKKIAVGSEDGSMKTAEARVHISELEGMQQKDEVEFEESLQQALCKEVKLGLPVIDILEINRLRRQILFHSCVWDQRLIRAASLVNSYLREGTNAFVPKLKEKPVDVNAAFKPSKGFSSCGSLPLEVKPGAHCNRGISGDIHEPHRVQKESGVDQDPSYKEADQFLSSSESVSYKPEPQESGKLVRRTLSDGEFPKMADLSDTLDAAWTGENHPANVIGKESGYSLPDPTLVDSSSKLNSVAASTAEQGGLEVVRSLSSVSSTKGTENMTNSRGMVGMPFSSFYSSFNKNSSLNAQKLTVSEYNPTYVMSLWDSERLSGARLFLPVGVNDTIVPVYDDEPTSVIAYTLVSSDYHVQISEFERAKDAADSAAASAIFDSVNLLSVSSFDDNTSDRDKSLGSADEAVFSTSGSRGSQVLDPLSYTKDLHARISFTDDGLLGKVKYTVTCYFAKRFDALRRMCCHSELDFIRSLSRCKKWGAQGGKSNVFFAKTLDDRFIIKQVPKTELESFIKFGPAYFKYLSESISTGSPTCLAKILGIYQVASKHFKGGKESKMDLLVMENLLFRRNITRLYDLKGSSRSRYNADTSGSNKVLLDQNLIEAMPTSPIFVGSKAKRLLERAVWNDTAFLASIDVMDYSLLVGIDEEKHELVLGIIDFMRQYTWDKHLETWVKTSGILGGPKNTSPTVISPQQYKKRFRKAMTTYFLMLPEQWTPPSIIHSGSQSDLCEENTHGGASFD